MRPSSLAKMRTPGLRREARQLDERRVADRLEDVLEAAAAGAVEQLGVGHRFSKCSERVPPRGRRCELRRGRIAGLGAHAGMRRQSARLIGVPRSWACSAGQRNRTEGLAETMRGTRLWILLALCAALALGVVAGCGSDDDDSTSGDSGTSGRRRRRSRPGSCRRHRHAFPAVRDRPAAGHLRLRHRADGRDRRRARPRGRVPGHRVRHDLPRHGERPVRHRRGRLDDHAGPREAVNFSDPYYEAQQALLVPEGSDIASVDDLARRDRRRPGRHHR